MATSRECEECGDVGRCRMYLDRDGHIIYLCVVCARELDFAVSDGKERVR